MPETTPLIKAALNLRVGAGFDVYDDCQIKNSKYENVTKIEGKLTLRWIYYEEILYNKNA